MAIKLINIVAHRTTRSVAQQDLLEMEKKKAAAKKPTGTKTDAKKDSKTKKEQPSKKENAKPSKEENEPAKSVPKKSKAKPKITIQDDEEIEKDTMKEIVVKLSVKYGKHEDEIFEAHDRFDKSVNIFCSYFQVRSKISQRHNF